jgi:hypothetical protein
VESTRSQNITVSCRRSASGDLRSVNGGAVVGGAVEGTSGMPHSPQN